jgi:hypothetical protein
LQYTYADANTQCCKYGLKLAVLETPEEVACVNIATCMCAIKIIQNKLKWTHQLLISVVHTSCNVWVGASRSSTGDAQWCQSNVPVSTSGLNITIDPDPLKQRYAIVLASKALFPLLENSASHVLCN